MTDLWGKHPSAAQQASTSRAETDKQTCNKGKKKVHMEVGFICRLLAIPLALAILILQVFHFPGTTVVVNVFQSHGCATLNMKVVLRGLVHQTFIFIF